MKETWSKERIRPELWPVLSLPVFQGLCSRGAELQLGREVRTKVFKGLSQLLVLCLKEGINVCQEWKWMPSVPFGRDTAVCAFEEKSLSQGWEKVVFPGFGPCPCGSVSNLKASLILACFAWPTQADNASDTCTVCRLIKTEKLNHCVGWYVGHLCYSQDSEGFNLT